MLDLKYVKKKKTFKKWGHVTRKQSKEAENFKEGGKSLRASITPT